MASLSKTMLIGRLGKDPELRFTTSGKAVTSFSVATSEKYSGVDGQKHKDTEWHNIVVWNKLAETCAKLLTKGKLVYIEGKIKSREYDARDGGKRRAYEIWAKEVLILTPLNGTGAAKNDDEDYMVGDKSVEDEGQFNDIPF